MSSIPEGLALLVSLTYAAAAVRMSRGGVLAQQLNATESLASVDTICVFATGTLTVSALRVVEALPAPGISEPRVQTALGKLTASASARNITLQAIGIPVADVPVAMTNALRGRGGRSCSASRARIPVCGATFPAMRGLEEFAAAGG